MVAGVRRRASTRVGRPSNEPWTTRSSRGATPMIAGRIQSIGGPPGRGRPGFSGGGGPGGGGGAAGGGGGGGGRRRDENAPPLPAPPARGRWGGEPLERQRGDGRS